MTDPSLNERLAEKLGWRKDPASPGYWIPPAADLPPKGVGYRCPDLLTYAGMGVVLEGMRGKGWRVEMQHDPDGGSSVSVWNPKASSGLGLLADVFFQQGLPQAVAEAALLALEGEGK